MKYFALLVIALSSLGLVGYINHDVDRPGTMLSIMSYNVGNFENPMPTTIQVTEIIRATSVPDILLVQDAPWPFKMRDLSVQLNLPYYISGRDVIPTSHLGILSRFPLLNPGAIKFQPESGHRQAALCVETLVSELPILLCNVQLPSTSASLREAQQSKGVRILAIIDIIMNELFAETDRSKGVKKLLAWIEEKEAGTMIVGGDLNTFPMSKTLRIIGSELNDAFWISGDYFRGTYLGIDFPLKPRIDFIFHTDDLDRIDAGLIQKTVGDHYPIFAKFGLPDQSE